MERKPPRRVGASAACGIPVAEWTVLLVDSCVSRLGAAATLDRAHHCDGWSWSTLGRSTPRFRECLCRGSRARLSTVPIYSSVSFTNFSHVAPMGISGVDTRLGNLGHTGAMAEADCGDQFAHRHCRWGELNSDSDDHTTSTSVVLLVVPAWRTIWTSGVWSRNRNRSLFVAHKRMVGHLSCHRIAVRP